MADDSQQQVATKTTTPATQADPQAKKSDKKNPLDVLENLLSEIEETQGVPGKKKAEGPSKEELEAQELEKKRKEYEAQQAEQAKLDAQLIEQQRAALEQNMLTSEENLARKEQDTQKAEEQQKRQAEQDGFEISQLDHSKI